MKCDTLRILTVYHKRAALANHAPFLPVQAGRAVSSDEWCPSVMQGDDTGDNISEKNPVYNEMSVVYWAWKNYDEIGSPDAVGLCHYRRFFIFEKRPYAYYEAKASTQDVCGLLHCTRENVVSLLGGCDFVAPVPTVRKSVYENFKMAHRSDDADIALDVIRTDYPDYAPAAERYFKGRRTFFYNMFIFPKHTFFRYCEWIFGVLEKLEARRTRTDRLFVSECLTGIFFEKLIEEGEKPLYLPVLYLTDERQRFGEVLKECRENLRSGKTGFVYAFRPLVVRLIPEKLLMLRRRKSALKRGENE